MNERNLIFHNASCCLCCGWYVFSRPAMPWTESFTSSCDVMATSISREIPKILQIQTICCPNERERSVKKCC